MTSNLKEVNVPHIPVSWGELIDKVTILEIKEKKISNSVALKNIQRELESLHAIELEIMSSEISKLKSDLVRINSVLWDVEEDLRRLEARNEFQDKFVELARLVYLTNDDRAQVKREINKITSSFLVEEKSYPEYPKHHLK